MKKGNTIQSILEQVKNMNKELKTTSTNELMFIQNKYIISQHHTLYELLISDEQRKTPLLEFNKTPNLENEEESITKLVERKWFDKHRHVYPYNKWLVYDDSNPEQSKPPL